VTERAIDPDKLKLYSFQLFSKLEGAVTAGMVHLGDRLGLYRLLAAAGRPMSSQELADAADLSERWVREWLHNQAAARLIEWDGGDDSTGFSLSPEAVAVLSDDDHPAFGMGMFHRLPQTMSVLERLPESFRTGLGLPYDAFGPEGAEGIERSFAPWYKNFLVPVALPALGDDVVERLRSGATVADIGCGSGTAIVTMAQAFPASRFHGYDISVYALNRAEQKRRLAGLDNASFHNARHDPIPSDNSLDLITTFDCLHDMTDPAGMMGVIRQAIKPDGVWLIADIKGRGSLGANIEKNPMAAMMYAVSVLSCMSSALSEPGGAGLGTLGLHEAKAREMTEAAGFSQFRRLDIDNPVNAFYEVRV